MARQPYACFQCSKPNNFGYARPLGWPTISLGDYGFCSLFCEEMALYDRGWEKHRDDPRTRRRAFERLEKDIEKETQQSRDDFDYGIWSSVGAVLGVSAEEAKRQAEQATRDHEKQQQRAREEEQQRLAFEELIKPRDIPGLIRFEHVHILGPSGSGKTQLLQRLILGDLQ